MSKQDILKLLHGKKIIIYGAGKIGKRIFAALRQLGYEPEFFWDKNAALLEQAGPLPVHAPDLSSIPKAARGEYAVVVTIFARNISREIADSLAGNGYAYVLSDRESVNSIIYRACSEAAFKNEFQFDINICHMCPVPKETGRDCDIFEAHLAGKIAKGVSGLAGKKDKLVVPKLGILVSNKCNLTCKGCNHLRDMYKPGDSLDISAKDVLGDLGAIVEAVDMVNQVVLVGGEAFLHPELPGILEGILELPKIGIVQIITNGTARPRDPRLFDLMANKRVIVEISGYGDKIPAALQGNLKDFMGELTKHGVNYQYVKTLQWFDFGGFERRQYTEGQRQEVYSSCCFISNDLFNGKLHKCSRSVFSAHLKKIPDYPADHVDLRACPKGELRAQLARFFLNTAPQICAHCNGTSTSVMEAGAQSRLDAGKQGGGL